MLARPKPGETEEEILAMQEAFLEEKQKNKDLAPSAKVVNLRKHKIEQQSADDPKHSKYTEETQQKTKARVKFSDDTVIIGDEKADEREEEEIADDAVYYPEIVPSVLGDIVERTYDDSAKPVSKKSIFAASGFPKPKKREKNITMRRSKSEKETEGELEVGPSSDSNMRDLSAIAFDRSAIIQGQDAMDIHIENKAVIERMTMDEIMEEKEKLAAMMDPRLLQYVKSLRGPRPRSPPPPPRIPPQIPTIKIDLTGDEDLKDMADNRVLGDPDLHNWVHFDTLERDKLQWIKNVEKVQSKHTDQPYEARFDFKGYLLPYTIEYTEETKTLFHHGEEPHRPGYSLSELFHLCRSQVTQQRALALNTIAGVLEYYSLRVYDNVIQLPITKIFFVLRFALDENITIILEPTLKALRNLFYNRVDEACLDFLLCSDRGLIQPRQISAKSKSEETDSDVSELKDFHLVDLDLVSGSIRTDILVRLRYILTVVKPPLSCVEYCIQILTRMFRDTVDNAENIFRFEGLIEHIVSNYIPKFISKADGEGDRCKIILASLKLIRVALSQSKSIAEMCCEKYKILECLLNYIGNTVAENVVLLKIQMESFYTWSSLLRYDYGVIELTNVKGVLLKILDNHVKGTDLTVDFPVVMHSHAAALITLLCNLKMSLGRNNYPSTRDIFDGFEHLIVLGIQKWTSQFCVIKSYTAGHLKSVGSLLKCLGAIVCAGCEKISNNIVDIDSCILKMIDSEGFSIISKNLVESSNLLSNIEIKNEESNIPSLNCAMSQNSNNLLPTLRVASPVIFISSLSGYVLISKNKELRKKFIEHPNILDYVKRVSSAKRLYLSENWMTKVELDAVCNIARTTIGLEFFDTLKEIIYNFSFKLTYILSPEYKTELECILKHIVFNKDTFSMDRLLKNLNIADSNNILNNLDAILECYLSILKLNGSHDLFSLTVSSWDQKILPRDWMFLPILGLYTKSHEMESLNIPKSLSKAKDDLVKHIVVCSLKWILVSELYFPEITNEMGLTDRFCRLSCVFLCDNSVFLDEEVKPLLKKCMKIIFDIENSFFTTNKLNFDKKLLGINSFQDFYTQLVDQFQAVSYGDPTFGACILVPLAQKHNVKWRKIVWSEYASCLRSLDCPEDLLCYRLEEYFNPPEKDFSLLKCYHLALISSTVRPETVTFKIAFHHVELAKERQRLLKASTSSMDT